MQIPKRPTDPIQFTLKEHEGLENAPVFTLKPLKEGIINEFNNLSQAGKVGSALLLAARYGVKGWENLETEFSDATNIEPLLIEWKYQLGAKVVEISSLTEPQKN